MRGNSDIASCIVSIVTVPASRSRTARLYAPVTVVSGVRNPGTFQCGKSNSMVLFTSWALAKCQTQNGSCSNQRGGVAPSRAITAMRTPSSGRHASMSPPASIASRSNTAGATVRTRYRSVIAKSWIMKPRSTPSTTVSGLVTVPSAPTTAHVRNGASMS